MDQKAGRVDAYLELIEPLSSSPPEEGSLWRGKESLEGRQREALPLGPISLSALGGYLPEHPRKDRGKNNPKKR